MTKKTSEFFKITDELKSEEKISLNRFLLLQFFSFINENYGEKLVTLEENPDTEKVKFGPYLILESLLLIRNKYNTNKSLLK